MDTNAKRGAMPPSDDLYNGRGQLIFIAVGLAIVLGGLWLLYSAQGPYHPGGDTQVQLLDAS